jgi:hypothetical protein
MKLRNFKPILLGNFRPMLTCPLLIHKPQGGLQPFLALKTEMLSNETERLQATPVEESSCGQAVCSGHQVRFFNTAARPG